MREFKNISPDVLSRFVNFYRDSDKSDWLYANYSDTAMQKKQVEGAAFLFNLLNERGIALLADEVGMGKTIQSLAVCAALWKQKPNAKILVLTPRNEISENWISEYETFVNIHYTNKDDIVKSKIGNEPINPSIFCGNLFDLVQNVQEKWGRLFIGKISSFSSLLSRPNTNERIIGLGIEPLMDYNDESISKIDKVRSIATQLRIELSKYLFQGKFDLLIIDEAHYFRNINGDSLKVNVAKEFFGDEFNRLAKRVLLLTATPNHTSSDNINAITSYFNNEISSKSYTEILNEICLRRFRRLSSKGLMKYNYREEIPVQSNFENDEMAELFFGIYQKQLVQDYMNEKLSGGRRNILGFLEGTEFIPNKPVVDDETSELKDGKDYNNGHDGQLLIKLSEEYKKTFGDYPAHPKYTKLIQDLVPKEFDTNYLNEKKLVFVRRIPSVREISRRAILKYDKLFIEKISNALGLRKSLSLEKLSRRKYQKIINSIIKKDEHFDAEPDNEFQENKEDDDKDLGFPDSIVLSLFKVLKKDSNNIPLTHATNFRLRFSRSKHGIFSIFFSPASNYFDTPYIISEIEKSNYGKNEFRDNFYLTCLNIRTSGIDENDKFQIREYLKGKTSDKLDLDFIKIELDNLFTIYWDFLNSTDKISEKEKNTIIETYNNYNNYEKEALSIFLEKGILLASSALIDLYATFITIQKKYNFQSTKLYIEFTRQVRKDFGKSALFEIINKSILNFSILYEKVFNINNMENLLKNNNWTNFFDTQPAYPYSGKTKNKGVMSSFNTPFYPDILVSTSVLQEGVNLQYFCDQIIHYGIAWTPGDNEQRVGRIDRMFSKIEKRLDDDESSRLLIRYPYLHNTIDQDHLVNFICNKYYEEMLIDKCQSSSSKISLNPEDINYENWCDYFRSPEQSLPDYDEPYPERNLRLLKPEYEFVDTPELVEIKDKLINTFRLEKIPVYVNNSELGLNSNHICILDPKVEERSQPVFAEMVYDSLISGFSDESTYVLVLKTPLGLKTDVDSFKRQYDKFGKDYENKYLNVKLCIDNSQNSTSWFGVYMKVELPIFVNNSEEPLSQTELISSFNDLINCADFIERNVFERDLSLGQDINISTSELTKNSNEKLRDKVNSCNLTENWKIKGDYVYLIDEIKMDNNYNLKDLWIDNHKEIFSKYIFKGKLKKMIIAYKGQDVQKVEMQTLEDLFKYRKMVNKRK